MEQPTQTSTSFTMPPKRSAAKKANTITSYFGAFNKDDEKPKKAKEEVVLKVEIAEHEDEVEEEDDDDEDDAEGSYFIDEVGNYYYRATKDSEPVLTEPPEGYENEYVPADEVEEYEAIIDTFLPPKEVPQATRKSSRQRKSTTVDPLTEDNKQEIVGFYVDEVEEAELTGEAIDEHSEEHLDDEGDDGDGVSDENMCFNPSLRPFYQKNK